MVRQVVNGASLFHGHSLNKSLLVGPDLLQNLLYICFGIARKKGFALLVSFVPGLLRLKKNRLAFVFGKARAAPMKALSIPELELQAALLASRLKEGILRAPSIDVTHTFF